MRLSLRDKRPLAALLALAILFLTSVGELLHFRAHTHALAHDAQCQNWFEHHPDQPLPAGFRAVDDHCPQCDWDALVTDAPTSPAPRVQVCLTPTALPSALPLPPLVRLTLALRESRGPPVLA